MEQDNPQPSRVSVEQLNTLQLRMSVLSQLAGIGDAMQGADPNNSTAPPRKQNEVLIAKVVQNL